MTKLTTFTAKTRTALRSLEALAFSTLVSLGLVLSPGALQLAVARPRRRGAGMLEYALVALISVGIWLVLRGYLSGLFSRLTGDIDNQIGG